MSSSATRRYPRIPVDLPATMDIQIGDGRKLHWTTIDVFVRTASCEGVGIKLAVPTEAPLVRNRKSVLHFHAGNAPIEIPGQVAWVADWGQGELDLGIRLNLALARATSRELYSSWIVASIISLRDYVDDIG